MEASSQPPSNSGMLKVLMDKGYQVLQLDQRGTGLSTPISSATLSDRGDVNEQVEFLKLFRADNIGIIAVAGFMLITVRDCETIRASLLGLREDKRWSILGQSFGGFCSITYLSFAYASLVITNVVLSHYERYTSPAV
jgi:pimeloyl-ACP methyl ester carboxylesterase